MMSFTTRGTGENMFAAGCCNLIPPPLQGLMDKHAACTDDYDFFEDMDDEGESCMLSSPSSPFHAEYSSKCGTPIASSISSDSALTRADDSISVICEVEDAQAPVSCRSFPSGESVCICIDGFRIMQVPNAPEVAEYKVKMSIDGVSISVWRRLKDFRRLAEVSFDYAPRQQRMSKSLKAWQKIEKNNPCWNTTLSSSMIVTETTLLKVFMKHMLYEASYLELLVDFMRD